MMFKLNSIDGLSYLKIEMKELENRYPSICLNLEINDRGFSGSLEVWIVWEDIEDFLQKSKDISYKDAFSHTINSMSPNEMKLEFQKFNPEICHLKYELNKISYSNYPINLIGSFDFDIGKLEDPRIFLIELKGLL